MTTHVPETYLVHQKKIKLKKIEEKLEPATGRYTRPFSRETLMLKMS